MTVEKLVRISPFLVVDGAIIVAVFLLALIDRIVHGTLYNYGLEYSAAWAVPYWIALGAISGLLTLTLVAITFIGVLSYKKAEEGASNTVFLCKSCGNALTRLSGNINVKESSPRFQILKKCPLCNKKLLEK